MTPEERIANVESQVNAVEAGTSDVIGCPYCGGVAVMSHGFCCDLLYRCVDAIMDRKEVAHNLREAARIANAVADFEAHEGPLVTIN